MKIWFSQNVPSWKFAFLENFGMVKSCYILHLKNVFCNSMLSLERSVAILCHKCCRCPTATSSWENNAAWDGCLSVSYKWDGRVGLDGYLRVGWSIEQLTLLIITLPEMDVAVQAISELDWMEGWFLGLWVKYRAAYAAKDAK